MIVDMKRLFRFGTGFLLCVLAFVSVAPPAGALFVHDPEIGFVLDLPVGFEEVAPHRLSSVQSAELHRILAIRGFNGPLSPGSDDRDAEAVLVLLPAASLGVARRELWPGDEDLPLIDLLVETAATATDAEGEAAVFTFAGNEALFAEVVLERSQRAGYLVAVELADTLAVLIATAPASQARQARDLLLSVLDSFGPPEPVPGPVAMFFEGDTEDGEWPEVTIRFPGPAVRFQFPEERVFFRATPGAPEAGDVLVSREARLLAGYQFAGPGGSRLPPREAGATADINEAARHAPAWLSAWRRYFRLIYRDTAPRLSDLATQIREYATAYRVPEEQIPDLVLSWLQAFEFRQAVNAGLFQPPVICLLSASGDCDSLGMTYIVLLHHLGFEAGMFVSIEHGHALTGVDAARSTPGPGTATGSPEGVRTSGRTESRVRFQVDGRDYYMAELTTAWPLGSVAREHTDQDDWHYVPLGVRD